MSLRIVEDGTVGRVPQGPRVVLPVAADLFATRAARFSQLAPGHAMQPFLHQMARLARAQQQAFAARTAEPTDADKLAASRQYGMPPLAALTHERAALWRSDLATLCAALRAEAADDALAGAADAVLQQPDAEIEGLADRVLASGTRDEDAALVPIIGAALQVYFTRRAGSLAVDDVSASDVPTVCPVCATRPVASVLRIGGAQQGLRYLHCALCTTEWNLARIQCTSCESEKGVHYLALAADDARDTAAVKAECCDECTAYLKFINQERDPLVDPVADDLATLTLDVAVGEQGFARSGPNLLFHPGESG